MKKILLTFLLLVVAVLEGYSQGLVNSNFGDEGEDPSIADRWKTWGDWIRREPSWYPKPGSGVLMGYHHYRISNEATSGFYQDIEDAKAGSTVRFYIFVILDRHDPLLNRPEKIELILESGKGEEKKEFAKTELPLAEFEADMPWQEITVEGKMPADGLRVKVSITPSPSAPRSSSLKFAEANLEINE